MSAIGEPVASYAYVDERGEMIHEVLRYEPKTFRQRRPDGHGGYLWGLNGARRVPYALPALRSAAIEKRTVIVCEGERDADTLTAAGFIATTSCGGAAWRWTPEFAAHFAGVRRVVIIADSDAPGRKAANERAEILSRLCDDIRVLDLAPDRSDGFDVSDWLASGGSADDLRERMEVATRFDPRTHTNDDASTEPPDMLARIESAAAIAGKPADVILSDVERMLPSEDAPGLVFGPPGSMKSWIALHLCDVTVSGARFLGHFDLRRRPCALYVNVDAGPKTFRNRIRRVSAAPNFDFISLSSVEFNLTVLRRLMERYRGGSVTLDCLAAIYNPDRNLDPAFAMREFVDTLRALYTEFDCGGIIIDHPHRPKETGAQGDYFGSVQKEAAFRSMWQVVADPPVEGEPRRTKITCRKLSEGEPFPAVYAIVDFSGERVTFSTPAANADPAMRTTTIEAALIAWATRQTETFSKTTIEKAGLGYRASELRVTAENLIARGIFVVVGKRSGGITYRLAESVPESVPAQSVPIGDRDGTDSAWCDETLSPSGPSDPVPERDGLSSDDGYFW